MVRLPRILPLFIFILLITASAFAQYGAGIEGTVTDPNSAVVTGVTVTATNQATGVARSAVTNDSGFYRISGLPPAPYTVDVESPNFQKYSAPDVQVTAEAVRGLDIKIQLAGVQTDVTVTAGIESLQTENANVGQTIGTQEVLNLPQYGRDPYQLLRLTPGVFGDASRQGNGNAQGIPQQVGPGGSNAQIFQTENQVQAIANGQRVSANNFLLDGVSVNSLEWGGAAVVTPNQESVQEVVVASNSYSAQDGRNSGAQVKVISKNGTNSWHGSGVAKFNDKGLNAFNQFYGPTNVPLTTLTCEGGTPDEFTIVASHCPARVDQRYREYAGSFGGPILKDKLFFFVSYEGVRLNNSTLLRDVKLETPEFEQYVQQQRPGGIAAQIFATPGIQPRISSTTSVTDCCSLTPDHPLGTWYAAGNAVGQAIGGGPDGVPDWGLFDLREPNSSTGDQYNARMDYTVGKNQFFASTYIVKLDNVNGGQRPIEDLTFRPNNYIGTIGWTRTLSNTMLNELRANFTRYDFDQLQPAGQTNFGIPQIRLFDFDAGIGDPGRLFGVPRASTTPAAAAQNTYALADTLNWVRGNHALRFGTELRQEQNNNNQVGGERPDYQFRGLLNFANDACCFFEGLSVDPTSGGLPNGQRYFRTADYAVFAQDDWKIRPNLTLNLGLRWEYFSPLTEAHNVLSNYVPGSQGIINGTVQPTDQLYDADWNNFGPRVGFAWSPNFTHNQVVFRGGFGLLYNRYFGAIFDNVRQNTPYFAEVSTCCFDADQTVVGAPPGSNIVYELGSSNQANSFAPNPNLSFGLAPDGALCGNADCTSVTKVDIYGARQQTPTPYVYVFSYEMQYEASPGFVIKAGYQGSRSRKLVRTIDLNRLDPGDTFDNDPGPDRFQSVGSNGEPCGASNPTCSAPHATGNNRFNRIFFPLPDVNSSFDAAVLSVNKRFGHGLQLNGNYTWSHAIDNTSYELGFQQTDPSNQLLDRASSDFDVRHNLSISALWQLPSLGGHSTAMKSLLGGWMISSIISVHSGFPFGALIGSCDTNNDRNGDGYCPDLPAAYNGGIIQSPDKQQWINGVFPDPASEFDVTTRGSGCRCRNIFSGPGYTSVDFSFGKDFALPKARFIGESSSLQLRANMFNAFNILNLIPLAPATAPTDIANTASFGRPSDGLAGRVIEFQARFSF